MSDRKYLSIFLDRLLPNYLRETYTKFEAWIRSYLEYLEEDGKVGQLILDFLHYIDIDKINEDDPYSAGDDEVLQLYIQQYLANFPLYRIEDIEIRKLIKNAKDFYSCKGTERSYDFIFRLMNHLGSFSFYYPQDDILVLSDPYSTLSSGKCLHDNYYRAYFTYEIQSTLLGYVELKDIIENLLHPAGCKCFFLRIVESEGQDPYVVEQNQVYNIFASYSSSDQWYPQFTYIKIYNDREDPYYGDNLPWTFSDFEYDDVFLLSQMDFNDWGDKFKNLEDPYTNNDYYPHQLSVQHTEL